MAIVTKPVTFEKGTPAIYTLNKTDLAAHATVAADPYFSIQANWKIVSVVMKSDEGEQVKVLQFDASLANPTSVFLASTTSRDTFEVSRITILDHDGDLNTAEFDIEAYVPVVDASLVFSADFDSSLNADIPLGLVPSTTDGATYDTGKVDLATATGSSNLSYLIPFDIKNKVSIGFDFEVIAGGITANLYMMSISTGAFGEAIFAMRAIPGGDQFYISSYNGGEVYYSIGFGGGIPSAGQTGRMVIEWDFLTLEKVAVYIDEIQMGVIPTNGPRINSTAGMYLRLGGGAPNHTATVSPFLNIDNVRVYDELQYLT